MLARTPWSALDIGVSVVAGRAAADGAVTVADGGGDSQTRAVTVIDGGGDCQTGAVTVADGGGDSSRRGR